MKRLTLVIFSLTISAAAHAVAPTGDAAAESTANAQGIENCPKCRGALFNVLPGDQQHKTLRTVESLANPQNTSVPALNTDAVSEGNGKSGG